MNFLKTTTIIAVLTIVCAVFSSAQTLSEPRQEKLLNGLKILIWSDSQAPKVTVKLRIHSGAAFDTKDKMGTMALLSDILFPNLEESKRYFTEDLEGSLDVTTNYDYIQISATGKPEDIQTILDTIATTITNPQITPESFTAVRNARLGRIQEFEKSPSYVAERAVAKRLFGDFPYGRSAEGTSESLAKIDKTDLLLARDRFFTADNATLVIAGNVKADSILRISRQLFGGWEKSGSKVSATFRQPDAPIAGNFFVEFPNSEKAELYQASRGIARNNKDFSAGLILADVLTERFRNAATGLQAQISVNNEPHLLFGSFIVKTNVSADKALSFSEKSRKPENIQEITDAEFEKSRSTQIARMNSRLNDRSDLAELWLDIDTYKLPSVAQQYKDLQNVTLADVNNVLENVIKHSPFVAVAVGDSGKLKNFLESNKSGIK